MRIPQYLALGAVLSISLMSQGCSNGSSPATTSTDSTYVTADYFPIVDGKQFPAHVKGTAYTYDADGALTETQTEDRDELAMFGVSTIRNGSHMQPLIGFDLHSGQHGGFFIGNSAGATIGMNDHEIEYATLLPASIKLGQSWGPGVTSGYIVAKGTATKHLDIYSAADGTAYNDVLQIAISYSDSTGERSYTSHSTLYLARNVGPVEFDLDDSRIVHYEFRTGKPAISDIVTVTGTATRKQ